jgi:DNA-binding NarL/FixJ family response regulator
LRTTRKRFKRICATLVGRSDFEVCGEAADGQEAVEKAATLRPDLIVLDITMPRMNGLEAACAILKSRPDTPILILSVHRSRQLVEEAKKDWCSWIRNEE